jgi:8-oxo-dGTP pyrophosphatase MutT (NUDIX family)
VTTPREGFGERLVPAADGDMPPARPAATAILVRDGAAGIEVLLLRRSDHGVFGGMWVFPGGRVDDGDPGVDDLDRARAAAVRETAEEAGATIDPLTLVAWSHWTPPSIVPKRYVTWFFIAPWPDGSEVVVDDHEVLEYRWFAPQAALDERLPMAPPTIVTLAELAAMAPATTADIRRVGTPPAYVTVPASDADGTLVMLWDGDAGYSTADPQVPGARHRMYMPKGAPPRFERSLSAPR